jgi:hypothetical protein
MGLFRNTIFEKGQNDTVFEFVVLVMITGEGHGQADHVNK